MSTQPRRNNPILEARIAELLRLEAEKKQAETTPVDPAQVKSLAARVTLDSLQRAATEADPSRRKSLVEAAMKSAMIADLVAVGDAEDTRKPPTFVVEYRNAQSESGEERGSAGVAVSAEPEEARRLPH